MKKIAVLFLCLIILCLSVGCKDNSNNKKNNNKVNLINNADITTSSYRLGDIMGDYTLTDINGNSHSFSKILKTKKAIVLNFWYINCGPCKMEFPFLQTAANTYSDDVAVIAINTTDKKESDIKSFAKMNMLDIPMVMGDVSWGSAFNLQGVPTTVIIDRYGTISFIHTGSMTNAEFNKLFAFFSSDNYKQTVLQNISDIK